MHLMLAGLWQLGDRRLSAMQGHARTVELPTQNWPGDSLLRNGLHGSWCQSSFASCGPIRKQEGTHLRGSASGLLAVAAATWPAGWCTSCPLSLLKEAARSSCPPGLTAQKPLLLENRVTVKGQAALRTKCPTEWPAKSERRCASCTSPCSTSSAHKGV